MATYQTVVAGDVIVVKPYLVRAQASLKAAELLQAEGLFEDAVSRAHQRSLHAERALLATEKRSPNDPRSVHRLASQHFLGNDYLDRTHMERLDLLFVMRNRADAQPDFEITADECAEGIGSATSFLADVTTFLTNNGHDT
jgi:uncharacterized protein (UPF0332 family)